jgi:hypothetical protein
MSSNFHLAQTVGIILSKLSLVQADVSVRTTVSKKLHLVPYVCVYAACTLFVRNETSRLLWQSASLRQPYIHP